MLRRVEHIAAVVLAVLAPLAIAGGAAAASDVPPGTGAPPWQETSFGGDATRNGWSAYSTLTVAPFSPIDVEGFRLRSGGGYGRYRYDGVWGRQRIPTEFGGITSFADLMIGYHLQIGRVTLKGFAGGSGIAHVVSPLDLDNPVRGLDIGFKAAIESWTELTANLWLQADASWTAAHETYGSRLRAGWRVMPEISIGLEGGLHGNTVFDGTLGGAFVRYASDWAEVSLSGGVTGDIAKPTTPYGSLSLLVRY